MTVLRKRFHAVGRAALCAALALACALMALTPTPAQAKLHSQTDWQENIDNREDADKPSEDDDGVDSWEDYEIGGEKKPKASLSNFSYCVTNLLYLGLEAIAGHNVDITNNIWSVLGDLNANAFDFTGASTSSEGGPSASIRQMYLVVQNVVHNVISKIAVGFLGVLLAIDVLRATKEASEGELHGRGVSMLARYIWMIAKYYFVMLLVNNVDQICGGIFTIFGWIANGVSTQIANSGLSFSDGVFDNFMIQMQSVTYRHFGGMWLYMALSLVITVVVSVTVLRAVATIAARTVEVYVMAAFGGLPIAFAVNRQTRQGSIEYLKAFMGVCLQTAVLIMLLACSGAVLAVSGKIFSIPSDMAGGIAGEFVKALGPLAGCLAIQSLVGQSREFANRIVGAH